jgi:hypothetical protein
MHRTPADPRIDALKERLYLRFPDGFRYFEPPLSLLRSALRYEEEILKMAGEDELIPLFDALTEPLLQVQSELSQLRKKELCALEAGLYRIKALLEDYLNDKHFALLRQGLLLTPTDEERAAITDRTYRLVTEITALPIRASEIPLQTATYPLISLRTALSGLETAILLSRFDGCRTVKENEAELHRVLREVEDTEEQIMAIYRANQDFLIRFFPAFQREILSLLHAKDSGAPAVTDRKEMMLLESAARALRTRLCTLLSSEDEPLTPQTDDRKANEHEETVFTRP